MLFPNRPARRSIMVTGQQVAVDDALSGELNLLFGRPGGPRRKRAAELLEHQPVHAGKRVAPAWRECADE